MPDTANGALLDRWGQPLRPPSDSLTQDAGPGAWIPPDPELAEVLAARHDGMALGEVSYTAEQPSGLYDFEFGPPYKGFDLSGVDADLREMSWQRRLDMWRRAHAAWERNPWAKGAIHLIRAFTVGTGHTMTYRAASVKAALEGFRLDPENNVERYDKELFEQLLIDGEIFIRTSTAPPVRGGNGGRDEPSSPRLVIDPLPPWWVLAIQTDPQFRKRVRSYVVQLYQGVTPEQTNPAGSPVEIPADEVFHVAINKLAYEQRGRSDLLAVLPWLRAYKDWLEDRARQNRYKAALYFHLQVANATPAQIAALRAQYRVAPPPASIMVTSDNVKLTTVDPKIAAGEVSEDGRQMRLAAAVGLGLPEYMLSDGANANLATTKSQALPAIRTFQEWQDIVANCIWRPLYRLVLQRAIEYGTVAEWEPEVDADGDPILDADGRPKLVSALEAYDLTYPPASEDDPKTLTEALVGQATQGWVSDETAMQRLGYDPILERKRLDSQEQREMTRVGQGLGIGPQEQPERGAGRPTEEPEEEPSA